MRGGDAGNDNAEEGELAKVVRIMSKAIDDTTCDNNTDKRGDLMEVVRGVGLVSHRGHMSHGCLDTKSKDGSHVK